MYNNLISVLLIFVTTATRQTRILGPTRENESWPTNPGHALQQTCVYQIRWKCLLQRCNSTRLLSKAARSRCQIDKAAHWQSRVQQFVIFTWPTLLICLFRQHILDQQILCSVQLSTYNMSRRDLRCHVYIGFVSREYHISWRRFHTMTKKHTTHLSVIIYCGQIRNHKNVFSISPLSSATSVASLRGETSGFSKAGFWRKAQKHTMRDRPCGRSL